MKQKQETVPSSSAYRGQDSRSPKKEGPGGPYLAQCHPYARVFLFPESLVHKLRTDEVSTPIQSESPFLHGREVFFLIISDILFFSLNLYELIKKNNYQGFSLSLIRRFANSLIQCLRLLHRENIIHCDLKPVSCLVFCIPCSFPFRLNSNN